MMLKEHQPGDVDRKIAHAAARPASGDASSRAPASRAATTRWLRDLDGKGATEGDQASPRLASLASSTWVWANTEIAEQHGPDGDMLPEDRTFLLCHHERLDGMLREPLDQRRPAKIARAAAHHHADMAQRQVEPRDVLEATTRLGQRRSRQRRHDAIAGRDHDQRGRRDLRGHDALAADRPLGRRPAGCRRTSRPGIRAPSGRRAARPRSASLPGARTRAPRCSAGPYRGSGRTSSPQATDRATRTAVCRMSTGSSPTWSATRASIGPADSRKAWPVRSAWKSQGAASRARPATRRGRRAASATVSVPPMQ